MKNARIFFLIPALIILILLVRDLSMRKESNPASDVSGQAIVQPGDQLQPQDSQMIQNSKKTTEFLPPLDRISERVTKKPFGIFIIPQNSPVQPEKFRGYHTGADFETFPEEQNIDVPIHAITDGEILMKESASGYGGVLIESGSFNGSPITIIYGHLNLASIDKKVGDSLAEGEQIGVLGKGYSRETDGERKHLHLGIHLGSEINILGYTSNKEGLKSWVDPITLLSPNSQ